VVEQTAYGGVTGGPAKAEAPCIVMGVETQIGLGLVRELGRAGVPVIAVAREPDAIGLASRHVWIREVVRSQRSAELLERLVALGQAHGPCSLLAVSEANVAWLVEQRQHLGRVRPALPAAAALAVVLDKQRTLEHARAIGIDTPRTEQPRSAGEAAAIASRFGASAVLKWSDPAAAAGPLSQAGLPLLKAQYADDAAELAAALRQYDSIGRWPLVQEYCRGVGLGQFFFMHQGQAIRRFQHLRVAEWPPEGGFSSVCDGVPLDRHMDLQEKSIALLQAIGWDGVAMVEYRLDPTTGRAVLMEINGRFWGSYPLAVHSGAGFGLLAHDAALGRAPRELPPPRTDLRCRMVATEVKRLQRICLAPARIQDRHFAVRPWHEVWRFGRDFLRPGVRYYVWSRDDPAPFWRDVRNAASAMVTR
jgi:predicted ATP-grasp superfamily ATP-dependent carboligase